jgi:hypothetical protein
MLRFCNCTKGGKEVQARTLLVALLCMSISALQILEYSVFVDEHASMFWQIGV